MYMISLSTRRSLAYARAVLALAALGVALNACQDNDTPVAPTSPAPSLSQSGGNGALVRGIGTAAVVWSLKDNTWQTLLGGGTFTIKTGTTLLATVTDNVAPDQDPTVGVLKVIGL